MKKFLLKDTETIIKRLKKINVTEEALNSYRKIGNNYKKTDDVLIKELKRDFALGYGFTGKHNRQCGNLVMICYIFKIKDVYITDIPPKEKIHNGYKRRLNRILGLNN